MYSSFLVSIRSVFQHSSPSSPSYLPGTPTTVSYVPSLLLSVPFPKRRENSTLQTYKFLAKQEATNLYDKQNRCLEPDSRILGLNKLPHRIKVSSQNRIGRIPEILTNIPLKPSFPPITGFSPPKAYLILQTFKKAGFSPSLSSYSFSGVSINESRKSDSRIV